MAPIGRWLVDNGSITADDLAWALERQQGDGGFVGQHLIDAGIISRQEFFAALARSWGLSVRDLLTDPPSPEAVALVDVEETAELGWVACEVTPETVVVATSVRPVEELVAEVRDYFPQRSIEFVACTQRDLDRVALSAHLTSQVDSVAVPPRRADPVVRPVHHLVVVIGAVVAVVLGLLLPIALVAAVVALATVPFLIGAAVQSALGTSWLAREVASSSANRGAGRVADLVEDGEVPLYTVLVPVGEPDEVDRALRLLTAFSYPTGRLDALLLVEDGDAATHDRITALAPPTWVRVLPIPAADTADIVRSCDHGLALARGRYIVAYRPDEVPDPDQLRRAVVMFETDLVDRLDGRSSASPLLGLRVTWRGERDAHSMFSRMTAVDDALRIDVGQGDRPAAAMVRDVTSTHFNMRLLRRRGGFAVANLVDDPDDPKAGRMGQLESTSARAESPGMRAWLQWHSQAYARAAPVAFRAVSDLPSRRGRGHRWLALQRAAAPAMFLAYPVVLGGAMVAAVRAVVADDEVAGRLAWVAVGESALVMVVAVVVAALVLLRRRGAVAAISAIALPAHWLLHSLAAWSALLAHVAQRASYRAGRS